MAGTVFPLTGPISIGSIKTKYGSTTTPVAMNEIYKVSTTGGNPKSPGVQSAGICDFTTNDTIPTSGQVSLSNFRGTGVRFVDQSNIQDTDYKDDWIGFRASQSGDLTGYADYGSGTGGSDFGTRISKGAFGADTSTWLAPVRVEVKSTASNNSGGIFRSDDGPDAPYVYVYVSPSSHPDSTDIVSTTFKNTWYALALREYLAETSSYQKTIYYKFEDAVEMNGVGSPALYGWYWDNSVVQGGVLGDIRALRYYYAYLVQAGF